MRSLIVLVGLLVCMVGCDLPMAKNPIGTRWQASEVAKFNGSWLIEGNDAPLTFLPQSQGSGVAGLVQAEADEKNPKQSVLVLHKLEIVFTRIGPHEFLFLKGIDEPKSPPSEKREPEGYAFWLITKREPTKLFLAVATDEFEKLVTDGKLSGKIIEHGRGSSYPLIDTDEKTFLSILESVGIEKCFDHKNVATIERIVAKTKPR